VLSAAGVPVDGHGDALIAIDKLDKIGPDGVAKELATRGVGDSARELLLAFFATSSGDALDSAGQLVGNDASGRLAVENLRMILALCAGTAAGARMEIDPSLARGLSYYTGAIMEITVPDLAGSLGGGGRYDNLVGMFLGQGIPACGFSLGLERILVVMTEREMFPQSLATTPADVMVSCFEAAGFPAAMRIASTLRETGLRVLLYPDADKIGKQIKYADSRGIPFVALMARTKSRTARSRSRISPRRRRQPTIRRAGAAIRKALSERG
jgi:histidyl-tRNA synthetase